MGQDNHTYLKQGVDDLKDLLLNQNRVAGWIRQQLDEAILQHGHEDVHGSHQRLAFVWFLVPIEHRD